MASLISAPMASVDGGASGLLGPASHLSFFSFQPVHSLIPPLDSRGAKVSKKIVLKAKSSLHMKFKNGFKI